MDTKEREPSRNDAQVTCPVCDGTGKRPLTNLANCSGTVRCRPCKGTGKVPQSYILTEVEQKVMDCIYEQVPAGTMCPRCEAEIDPDQCIEDTTTSRKEWAKLVREVIKIAKEDSNGIST